MALLRYHILMFLTLICTHIFAQSNGNSDSHTDKRQLTVVERTYGLVQFWSEAKYNFAYFDQVPELDWDAALKEYLPLIQQAQDDDAYYRLLGKFCALLKNVNTNIIRPKHLTDRWDRPQLGIELIDSMPVVVNRSIEIGEQVPLGAMITSINQIPLETHLEQNVYPYITAGGDQVRRRWAAHDLLKGPAGGTVSFTFQTLDGKSGSASLLRNRKESQIVWEVPRPERYTTRFKILDDKIGFLTLNSFQDTTVVEEFLKYLPEIKKCNRLVIDLRTNMSGSTEIAYAILRYFINEPLLTSSWRTREHRSASWARGRELSNINPETLSKEDSYNQQMYLGEVWYVSPSDTLAPALEPVPIMPVAVLVSNYTAAGAEQFLVAADALENFIFIGESSFGDTPQSSTLSLPGGGSARISSKRDTYPDGRVFVGSGVDVDIIVAPSISDHLDNRDVVLAKALEVLK